MRRPNGSIKPTPQRILLPPDRNRRGLVQINTKRMRDPSTIPNPYATDPPFRPILHHKDKSPPNQHNYQSIKGATTTNRANRTRSTGTTTKKSRQRRPRPKVPDILYGRRSKEPPNRRGGGSSGTWTEEKHEEGQRNHRSPPPAPPRQAPPTTPSPFHSMENTNSVRCICPKMVAGGLSKPGPDNEGRTRKQPNRSQKQMTTRRLGELTNSRRQ